MSKWSPLAVLFLLATFLLSAATAAQDPDTVFDEADILSASEEREVQDTFAQTSAETGDPLYAILRDDTNISPDDLAAQEAYVRDTVREENLPEDAGVIVVDPQDEWSQVYNLNGDVEESIYEAMQPSFSDGDFADGLIAGAAQLQDSLSAVPEMLTVGGVLGAVAAVVGGAFFFVRRRRSQRELEEQRAAADREFGELTERIGSFDEKERLVSGYLEAQRPLLDTRCEDEVEARIQDARAAGFGEQFNGAAGLLTSDPRAARERLARGRTLLEEALGQLDGAEATLDDYRAADEALEGRLHEAAGEIEAAADAEARAADAGVAVEPLALRPEYDRLAREAADRAANRNEFDPRKALGAVDALAIRAQEQRAAMEAEVSARTALPEERAEAKDALGRAREAVEEYARSHATEQKRWGPAAIEDAPVPAELSADLRHAAGAADRAVRTEAAGRFVEAHWLLADATETARTTMQAPGRLKTVVAEADRRRREGEKKLEELETRLEEAKANRHLMNPRGRRRLQEYERKLDDARGGFFGADWVAAILIFEALDTDYAYMGDPGGDWAGGDYGGGGWEGFGGGDFGGGGFGGDGGGGGF